MHIYTYMPWYYRLNCQRALIRILNIHSQNSPPPTIIATEAIKNCETLRFVDGPILMSNFFVIQGPLAI